jgi:fatty-acyl-CoA synthase
LNAPGVDIAVTVASHAVHGNLITVHLNASPDTQREPIEREVHRRLDPLVTKHEVVWE